MMRFALAASLLAALPFVLPAPAVGAQEQDRSSAVSGGAVAEGADVERADDALNQALAAVRRDPNDPEVHAQAARAAKAAEKPDRALFHARLTLIGTRGDREFKTLNSEMESIITELDPLGLQADEAIRLYLEQLCSQGDSARVRKLWANAVDLYLRCEGTAAHDDAQKGLDRIYSSSDSGEALVRSGLDVPVVGGKSRKSPKEIAKFDEDYAEWEKAEKNRKLDVRGYEIRTNMGWEIGQQIGFALTQINDFLRTLYRHKEAGQKLRDCNIRVYATFKEFAEHEGVGSSSIGGFFSPGENRIATYDQRTVGRSMDDLWETLFHEASHQFSQDVSKTLIPVWVEEGIACFMEGTVLLPNGTVIPNQIAESRLESLVDMMESGYDPIRDVITYYQPGSYSGQFYPWGWGLVYFMRNYEDENSERVYLPWFDEFVKEYKGEAQHDVWARFVEYFVEKPERPGIEDFQAWYQLWRNWIMELHEIHFGGPEQADKLIAKAQRQIANEKFEYAVETLVWALRKRPNDAAAMHLMTVACLETDREDTAMYYFRELLDWCDAQSDPKAEIPGIEGETVEKLRESSIRGMEKINRNLAESIVEKKLAFEEQVRELAKQYLEKEMPLTAALLVKRTQELAGRNAQLVQLESKIATEHQVDPRLERDLVVDEDLSRWESFDAKLWRAGANGTLQSVASRVAVATISYLDEPDTTRYRFEAKIKIEGDSDFPVFGVTYGERVGRGRQLGYIPFEGLCEMRMKGREPVIEEEISDRFIRSGEELQIAIEVDGNDVEYFVDGESVLKKMYPTPELKGRVGFFAYNTEITVSDMKLTY